MYEIYMHKTDIKNPAQSPEGGIVERPKFNEGINLKQAAGIGIVASQLIPAGKQMFNAAIQNTGDIRLQRTIKRISNVGAFGATSLTLGILPAIGAELIKTGAELYGNILEERNAQRQNQYETIKRGNAISKFVGIGARYD